MKAKIKTDESGAVVFYTTDLSQDGTEVEVPQEEQRNGYFAELRYKDGACWWEYVPQPELEEPQQEQQISYEEAVAAHIRARYSVNDEIALLRQRDVKPEEFAAYNAYCEECKAAARKEVGYVDNAE